MNNVYLKNIIRFVVLVVIQVIVLDRINFNGFVNPYLYIYFILLLPIDVSKWVLLLSAFLLGSAIDMFSHTPGLHASASVMIAFIRPFLIRNLSIRGEYEPGLTPGISELGFNWFFIYALVLVFIHHIFLFYLEVFRFSNFFDTLLRAIYSILFTMILVIISQFLFYKNKR
jgi:hypothetical protein